ncbi:ABC transporter substrate-binding protein [Limobrevibacterium gyesilva]|uniref:ABC transporter substrate-binding protein n=1 Tax=Limobrevibacterium gyesilva TaxID=2991712 RepID=A0AA42CDQ4_9PROT|nr:ABC transporter substrate-binding protein [Limobrevibacterium gyesilva]MCW3474214.1 ABC transporter substrate-binding protein [Limobrevibacterium gyesilva]
MKRRDFLAGGAAALGAASAGLPCPAVAQPVGARTLAFIPQANLTSLDPIWTTATVTRNYGFMVFDTLYGLDAKLNPLPQMAEGHVIEDDGKRWTIKLRPGLMFHDNTPVLASDCVASLQRWMKRDGVGQTIAGRMDALEAPDDRTLVFRLKKPFPAMPFALAKTQPSPPFIMPARIAAGDAFKQITEVMGSGPFQFVQKEYVSGSLAVFSKFAGYKPREDTPSFTAGAKRALVDRVEWRVIPDAATANNALRTGEADWIEIPLPDLIPQLKADRGVVVDRLDPYGLYPVLRPNHAIAPTSNRALRQAMLAAVNPVEVMQSFMGDDASTYHAPIGCFLPGTPYENTAGMDRLGGKKSVAEIQAMLKSGGYNNERVLLMHPTDQPFYDAMSQVVSAQLKRVGINIDDVPMDWGTVVQRRAKRDPLESGGWSLFCTSFPAVDYLDPLSAPGLRANGVKGWYGAPEIPKLEALREAWIDSPDLAERKRLATEIQALAFEEVMFIPLGNYLQSAAWRKNITGHLKGPVPVFWNVEKA